VRPSFPNPQSVQQGARANDHGCHDPCSEQHGSRQPRSWLILNVRQRSMSSEHLSLAEIVGPWRESASESGLVARTQRAWSKPIGSLTNQELATCLRQAIAVQHLLPMAKKRVAERFEDESDIDDGELSSAIEHAEYHEKREQEHQSVISARFSTDEKPA
jgi:hypothetical protein